MKNSKKIEFFSEIYVEELPARLVNDLGLQLKNNFIKGLAEHNIEYLDIVSKNTPRRLTIYINGLDKKTKDKNVEIWGPPKKICFDEKGNILKPGLAFLNKNGIKEEEIKFREKNNSEFLYLNKEIKGSLNKENLKNILCNSLKDIKNKKFMRWGEGKFPFVRPIRNIYANFDSTFLKIKFESIESKNLILGHRFSKLETNEIKSYSDYLKFLRKGKVILCFEERKAKIISEIDSIEKEKKFFINKDQDLLDHVANLTEFPIVLIGKYNKDFLKIPKEVINSVMKNHQKYFSVYKNNSYKKLVESFAFVAGSPFLNSKTVINGNEKVLNARLSDGKFFYEEDSKLGLNNIRKKIDKITFIDGMGSYGNKAKRIIEIAKKFNILGNFNLKTSKIAASADLCKADLASQMVFEFPELQGIMGEYYYKDIDIEVSETLSQHYLPKGRSDELPKTILSKIISLSDRFDNLASAFSLKLYPTGSSDPYGLRRSCIGIIRITESLDIKIDLNEILDSSFTQVDLSVKNKTDKESKQKAKHFILDRVKNYYVENGFSVNILNSVLETNKEINIKSISNKINAIKNLTGTPELEKGVEIFKRLKNITKNNNSEIINETLLTNNYEQDLLSEIKRIERFYNENSNNRDSEICLYEIIKSFDKLADFFENVLVMDKNEEIKNNRINLLTKFKNLISEFSNLSEL